MLRNVILLLACAASDASPWRSRSSSRLHTQADRGSSDTNYTEAFFTTDLDHFNGNDGRQFEMRYLVPQKQNNLTNNSFNAIFIYTGNEGSIEDFYGISGFVREAAQRHNAAVVFAEHRYYGKSFPFMNGSQPNDSFTRENIRFLTAEQTLADYAALVAALNVHKLPVIAFGGSYGGWLSAWFRMKYPHLCTGALAASANLALAAGVIDQNAYFSGVTEDFARIDERCPDLVRAGFRQLLDLQSKGDNGTAVLASKFVLCNNSASLPSTDKDGFIQWIMQAFISVTQLDYPYPVGNMPGFPAKESCDLMIKGDAAPLDAIAEIVKMTLGYKGGDGHGPKCFTVNDTYSMCADQTGCGANDSTAWAWDYQCCTENFALGTSTNNVTDMFPPREWEQKELDQYCLGRWGLTPRRNWIATNFGSTVEDWAQHSNIIFSNGLLDPFHVGGVLHNVSSPVTQEPALVAVLVEDGAHHYDLRGGHEGDTQSVLQARYEEDSLISSWLAEGRNSQAQAQAR